MNSQKRKLAAIVFTDIVGFTKLSSTDQNKAAELLKIQREVFKPLVKEHNGDWVKEMGDGLLLVFGTVMDAVECSINIQKSAASIEYLDLRIGIHQGEILIDGDDVIGDDVNVASRIEPFAATGGIAISDKINTSLNREAGFDTEYLGKPKLKGVEQEVKVYCITSHGLPRTDLANVSAKLDDKGFKWNAFSITGAALTLIGIIFWINISFIGIGVAEEEEVPSIAIIPFKNKGAAEDEFFAYGISSDLISDVTETGMIRVAGLNDIERLDHPNLSYDDLADALLVRYVAKGTLWKMDTLFQLSMELFDTKNSEVVWSNRWQTAWEDLGMIKDDLANKILENLQISVIKNIEQADLTNNSEAYEYYLKGKYRFDKRVTIEDLEIAKGFYKKAVDLDSTLIIARGNLATTYAYQSNYDRAIEIYNALLKYSERVNNEEGVAIATFGLGSMVSYKDDDHIKAMEYYERSLMLVEKHNLLILKTKLLNNMAHVYRRLGQVDKSLSTIQENARLAKQLGDKPAQIYSLFALAGLSEDQDEVYEYYKEGLSISQKAGLKNEEGLLLRNISNWLIGKKEYASALDHANRSREIFNKLEDKEFEANSLDIMGQIYIEMGDYKKTLECAMESLGLHDEIDNERGVFYATNNIGSIYHEYIKDYDKALEYFSRLSNQTNPKYVLTYHNSLGKLYYSMGDYGRVLEDWSSAHEIAIELGLKNWEVRLQRSLGHLHSSRGEMDKSLDFYERALESFRNLKSSKRVISNTLADIGRVYFIKKDYDKAMVEYFVKALEINNEIGNEMSLANTIYLNLCYRNLGEEYDAIQLNELIDEEKDISFHENYRIFQLLGERSYLETAYKQVKEKGEALSGKVRERFYDYPLPESIINAFEKAI
tara:strand:- start:2690 stop:5344 length:2655 start_codon:yes stop_codon:yes gene_type:complete